MPKRTAFDRLVASLHRRLSDQDVHAQRLEALIPFADEMSPYARRELILGLQGVAERASGLARRVRRAVDRAAEKAVIVAPPLERVERDAPPPG